MVRAIIWLFVAVCLLTGVAPAGATGLTDSDRKLYQAAFTAAEKGDWKTAWAEAGKAHDQLPAEALQWYAIIRSGGSFDQITGFIVAHPDWPNPQTLEQRAEEAMDGVSDATVGAWFADHPPVTTAGKFRQGDIWVIMGERDRGEAAIRQAWIDSDLNSFDENTLLQRYTGVLRQIDNDKRLDRLLWDDQTAAAQRMLAFASANQRALAGARLALASMSLSADQMAEQLPPAMQNDPGVMYDRERWRRRNGMDEGAIQLLDAAPQDAVHAVQWAAERQIMARRALAAGTPDVAMRVAERHQTTTGAPFAELEFLSGWIALRFLNKPDVAYDHFVRLYNEMKLPISLARGAYWAGRAAEAMGKHDLAMTWYDKAADRLTTYYGQLAASLHGGTRAGTIKEPKPSLAVVAAFNSRPLVRVTRALGEAGSDNLARIFLRRLSETAQSPDDYALVTQLAIDIHRPDLAVASAKRAGYAGINLIAEGYPLTTFPKGGKVETPLLLALTRQESAFDGGAVSSAGARGLMQIMPKTASLIAKALRMPFSQKRLTNDRQYNVTLGRAYLDGLLSDFSGSYVLSIAAYNAGPARVKEWMRDYGDPRSSSVDVVDWVESIPFSETRNYVQRVLENLQVYRLRLGETGPAFTLASDLRR
jgi:soluble lytic murein transglycosylase